MSNNFLQFDPNKNNMMSNTDYENSTYRIGGATSGVAPSNVHNRLFYQISTMMAAIGKALSNKSYTVSDADIDTLTTLFESILAVNADWNATSGVAQILNKPALTLVQSGSIVAWPTQNVPDGYFECNGASKLIASYPDLYAVISDDYGSVDSTHFNLPDLRGYFLRGWDHGVGRDPDRNTRTNRGDGTSGDYVGTKQADALKDHDHNVWHGGPYDGSGYSTTMAAASATNGTSHGIIGGGGAAENRPLNINVMWIIKY